MQVAGKRVRRKRCGKFRRGKRKKGDKIDGFFFYYLGLGYSWVRHK